MKNVLLLIIYIDFSANKISSFEIDSVYSVSAELGKKRKSAYKDHHLKLDATVNINTTPLGRWLPVSMSPGLQSASQCFAWITGRLLNVTLFVFFLVCEGPWLVPAAACCKWMEQIASMHSEAQRLFLFSIQIGWRAPSVGLTVRWTALSVSIYTSLNCVKKTAGREGINACYQFFPTRMLGLRRGSRFGSEPAAARPSFAMMMIKVKNPITPTTSSMKTRCFQERDVRFPPERFLKHSTRKTSELVTQWHLI